MAGPSSSSKIPFSTNQPPFQKFLIKAAGSMYEFDRTAPCTRTECYERSYRGKEASPFVFDQCAFSPNQTKLCHFEVHIIQKEA